MQNRENVIQSHSNREYTRGKPQKCGFSKAGRLVCSNRFFCRGGLDEFNDRGRNADMQEKITLSGVPETMAVREKLLPAGGAI